MGSPKRAFPSDYLFSQWFVVSSKRIPIWNKSQKSIQRRTHAASDADPAPTWTYQALSTRFSGVNSRLGSPVVPLCTVISGSPNSKRITTRVPLLVIQGLLENVVKNQSWVPAQPLFIETRSSPPDRCSAQRPESSFQRLQALTGLRKSP